MGTSRCPSAVALAVSLSWMCIVALVPAHDRPYVDGSCNNSVFSQVFLYNGADRLNGKVLEQPGCSPPPAATTTTSTVGGAPTVALNKGPARYLAGALGRDAAWLFIPAMVALGGILIARRRRPRTDPWRAAAVLWGLWMVLTWAFFADSQFLNAYYLAALAPPMAALCGLGLVLGWRIWRTESQGPRARRLRRQPSSEASPRPCRSFPRSAGVWPWVVATTIVADRARLSPVWRSGCAGPRPPVGRPRRPRAGRRRTARRCSVGIGHRRRERVGSLRLALPVAALTASEQAGWQHDVARWPALAASRRDRPDGRSIETAETSAEVSQDVLATGHEYLPVGGFSGQVPSTPLTQFVRDVHDGRIVHVLVAVQPLTRNPDMRWVSATAARRRRRRARRRTDYRATCVPANAAG